MQMQNEKKLCARVYMTTSTPGVLQGLLILYTVLCTQYSVHSTLYSYVSHPWICWNEEENRYMICGITVWR